MATLPTAYIPMCYKYIKVSLNTQYRKFRWSSQKTFVSHSVGGLFTEVLAVVGSTTTCRHTSSQSFVRTTCVDHLSIHRRSKIWAPWLASTTCRYVVVGF